MRGLHPFHIRPYRLADQDAVTDLFVRVNQSLAPSSMKASFEAYVSRSLAAEIGKIHEYYDRNMNRSFWVTSDGSRLLGYFGLEPAQQDAVEIRRMYVDFPFRRMGIARAMLVHAEEQAQTSGFARIVLSTSILQRPALALYLSAGFTLLREERAQAASHKTVGQGIVRFHLEKRLPKSLPVQV